MPVNYDCRICGQPCKNYRELALHISTSSGRHTHSKKWASKYLIIGGLSPGKRRELPKRVPGRPDIEHGEYWTENQVKATREISGETLYANTVCPRCKKKGRQLLPAEYVSEPSVWRWSGYLVVLCDRCRG